MRVLTIVMISTSVLVGAALVRGVTYTLTHAAGVAAPADQFAAR